MDATHHQNDQAMLCALADGRVLARTLTRQPPEPRSTPASCVPAVEAVRLRTSTNTKSRRMV